MAVAEFLEKHPQVARVHYPGLPSHPDHALAKKQMRGFGSMLAFDVKGGLPAARRFCDRVQLFLLAASLGGVESLVVLPAYTSHYNMSDEELLRAGVTPGTVRVSIGVEDSADLIAELRQALAEPNSNYFMAIKKRTPRSIKIRKKFIPTARRTAYCHWGFAAA